MIFKKKKIRIGIELDEIIRSKWIQFDRFYVAEFGESGVPEDNPYVFDYFNTYKWNESNEKINVLKEDVPDIRYEDYQVSPETGIAPADNYLFDIEKKSLTPKQVYNRFMYEDYLFEIFGSAPIIYRNADVDIQQLTDFYERVEFIIISKEEKISIQPTLYFLSKLNCKFRKYRFISEYDDVWKDVDILITTNPHYLNKRTPLFKKIIKVERPYNVTCKNNGCLKERILQLNDLSNNIKFEKLIK